MRIVMGDDDRLEIAIPLMGDCNRLDGAPIYLEKYEGQWLLWVSGDINQEEPTHRIDLSAALESNRKQEKVNG